MQLTITCDHRNGITINSHSSCLRVRPRGQHSAGLEGLQPRNTYNFPDYKPNEQAN
jgi:hypothetical protein